MIVLSATVLAIAKYSAYLHMVWL